MLETILIYIIQKYLITFYTMFYSQQNTKSIPYFVWGSDETNNIFESEPTNKHSLSNFEEIFLLWSKPTFNINPNVIMTLTYDAVLILLLKLWESGEDETESWDNNEHARDNSDNLKMQRCSKIHAINKTTCLCSSWMVRIFEKVPQTFLRRSTASVAKFLI